MSAMQARGAALALPDLRAALALQEYDRSPGGRLPEAQWLASRGARAGGVTANWRAWLLEQYGPGAEILAACPAGVAVRAVATGKVPPGCWACAEPVHLLTELDRLRLAPGAPLELTDDEARALAVSLNAGLEGSGFVLHAASADSWSIECHEQIECTATEPTLAEGRDIRELLPGGRDGPRVRWLMNELQVALHDHPVNLRRAERGVLPVNTLWPWGFGTFRPDTRRSLPSLYCDDAWLRGIWQLGGSCGHPLAEAPAGLASRTQAPVLLAGTAANVDRAARAECWEKLACAPLAEALRSRRLGEARLLLSDTPYRVPGSARFAAWRRRRAWTELLA